MNRLWPLFVAAALVFSWIHTAGAQEQVLAGKGLVKSGPIYVLAGEQDLADGTRAIRVAKAKFDTETKERQQVEQRIAQAKNAVSNLEFERKRISDSGRPNPQAMARIESQLEEIARFRAEADGKLKTLGEQTRADFINKVVAAADLAEKLSAQYEQLAADDAVKQAIDKINEAGRGKFRLGPSPDFIVNANAAKKLRGEVNSAVIPLRMRGRVPATDVILNGKLTREFVVDSGASSVVLPGEMAEELGLNPTDKDPTIRMQLADGKVIEGKQMTLKTVRVGIFTVEDVECSVMPKNLVAVSPLLGGSFLHNFVYKLDPEQGELHLAQIPGKESKIRVGDVKTPAIPKPPVPKPDLATPAPKPAPKPAAPDAPDKDPIATNTPPSAPVIPVTPTTPDKPAAPDKPAVADTPVPVRVPGDPSAETKRVMDYLDREYKRKLETPDWRQRGLAVICLARLPQTDVTNKLINLIDNDKHEVVRLLAWEAVLARASELSSRDFQRFYNSTQNLADKGIFHGSLRPSMLDVLAAMPMNPHARRIFEHVLAETNAWETQDIPTLRALGRCLEAWKSGQLADALIRSFSDQNMAYRSEYVLQTAGVSARRARDYMPATVFAGLAKERNHMSSDETWATAQNDYFQWLQKNRKEWSEAKPAADAYKSLRSLYVAAPVTVEDLEKDPTLWKPDLELGSANIKAFEVCFVVDATGSMGEVLDWLSRDIKKMMAALGTLSLEPRLGLTFYRDYDDDFITRGLPLGSTAQQISDLINATGADGGGDIPEAVMSGMQEAINKNRWSNRQDGGKVLVIIGDAPPHPNEVDTCLKLAADARKKGFKIYAAKVTTDEGANDLTTFEQIAHAGGGATVDVTFGRLGMVRFVDPRTKKEIPLKTVARPEAQFNIAPSPVEDQPGEKILEMILADAVNPAYRKRLGPLIRTLLAFSEPASPQEKRMRFPANTPPAVAGKLDAQGK